MKTVMSEGETREVLTVMKRTPSASRPSGQRVVETSEPVYATQFDARYAAYQRMKEKPSLFGPVPTTGGKEEGAYAIF